MVVIAKSKTSFVTLEYTAVSNIAYNSSTKVYTITHGNNQTVSLSGNDYLVAIMFS